MKMIYNSYNMPETKINLNVSWYYGIQCARHTEMIQGIRTLNFLNDFRVLHMKK